MSWALLGDQLLAGLEKRVRKEVEKELVKVFRALNLEKVKPSESISPQAKNGLHSTKNRTVDLEKKDGLWQ